MYPVAFENQVIFSRLLPLGEVEVLGFNGTSGQLLWQSAVPAYLTDKRYRQIGSKLYFADRSRTSLLSFDLATQKLETVWMVPAPATMSFYFAVQEGFVICPVVQDLASDSVAISAHLVNLQSGASREVLRFHTLIADHNGSGILDPKVTITPAGDTVFCFVRVEYQQAFTLFARFSSWNISTHAVHESDIWLDNYYKEQNHLIVEGQYAWFLAGDRLQCTNVSTGAMVWTAINSDFTRGQLLVKQGKIVVSGNGITAFDAENGTALWSHPINNRSGDLRSSFLQAGQLFLIHAHRLISVDFETGCLTGDHALPADFDDALANMTLAPDGESIYLLGVKNFYAVPLPE